MGLLVGIWDLIVAIIATLGYPGLFVMMALESMLAPVPSEVVMPFAGYLVWEGTFGMPEVLLVSLAGSIVGSLLSYWIGLAGGRPFVERYGKWLLIGRKELAWTDRFFARYGAVAVLVARFIPVVRHVISIPAGVARMPMRTFLPATIAGAFVWNAFLAYAGLSLGPGWRDLGAALEPFETSIIGIGIALVVLYVGYKLREARLDAAEAAGGSAPRAPEAEPVAKRP